MLLVSDLIYSAMRIAGLLTGPRQDYSPDDGYDGLNVLNAMVDTWKAERLTVYAILRNLFDLEADKGGEDNPYVIGLDLSKGEPDFYIERPEKIQQASYVIDTVEVPMALLNEQQYQSLAPKDLTGPIPTMLYYRPLVPNGHVILWAVPNDATVQLALYTWQGVTKFNAATDPVILPPAAQEAIEYNLAVRLAMRYPETKITPMAVDTARTSLAKFKAANIPDMLMQCERANRGIRNAQSSFNIFSNRYA